MDYQYVRLISNEQLKAELVSIDYDAWTPARRRALRSEAGDRLMKPAGDQPIDPTGIYDPAHDSDTIAARETWHQALKREKGYGDGERERADKIAAERDKALRECERLMADLVAATDDATLVTDEANGQDHTWSFRRGKEEVEVTVNVCRSAGVDGALVVTIGTDFESDGSDDGPGLRINLNDAETFTGVPYKAGPPPLDGMTGADLGYLLTFTDSYMTELGYDPNDVRAEGAKRFGALIHQNESGSLPAVSFPGVTPAITFADGADDAWDALAAQLTGSIVILTWRHHTQRILGQVVEANPAHRTITLVVPVEQERYLAGELWEPGNATQWRNTIDVAAIERIEVHQ